MRHPAAQKMFIARCILNALETSILGASMSATMAREKVAFSAFVR